MSGYRLLLLRRRLRRGVSLLNNCSVACSDSTQSAAARLPTNPRPCKRKVSGAVARASPRLVITIARRRGAGPRVARRASPCTRARARATLAPIHSQFSITTGKEAVGISIFLPDLRHPVVGEANQNDAEQVQPQCAHGGKKYQARNRIGGLAAVQSVP